MVASIYLTSFVDAVRYRLLSLEAATTMLKLSSAIYPPGAWTNPSIYGNTSNLDVSEEAWEMRNGLTNWAWRAISEIKDVKDESEFMQLVSFHV